MKISIITVCKNSEKTIEQTIQSVVRAQDGKLEYIIVDGGSSDGTLDIIKKYEKEIEIAISEPDGGIYEAMNKGIALASGEVIGIINSDDWYEPETFDIVRRCFCETDAEVVCGKLNFVYPDGKREIMEPENIEKLRYEMIVPHPTAFVKREAYWKYGEFETKFRIAADYELMLRFYTKGAKFCNVDRVLANFRVGGASRQQKEKCAEETMSISKKYLFCTPLEERIHIKDIIARRYLTFWFEKLLEDSRDRFVRILNEKLGVGYHDEIVIFGAGKWGQKVCGILQKKMWISYIVDNGKKKQGCCANGVRILEPEILKSFKGILLLMVKDYSAEILSQVEDLRNSTLYCISWEEIAEEFVNEIRI